MFAQLPYPVAPAAAAFAFAPAPARPLRLCLVGDGGECARLAPGLTGWGRVLVLDSAAQDQGALDGVDRVRLLDTFAPSHLYTPLLSLGVYHWLAAQDFDLVLFVGQPGLGYYSLVARDLGLAFARTTLAVWTVSAHAFRLEAERRFPEGRTDIELDFLERQAMARADALLCADSDFVAWCRHAGWTLPALVVADALQVPPGGRRAKAVAAAPFISVCMATHDRADLLPRAVESLKRQSSQYFELILVDDGSSDPAVAACLTALEPDFRARGWTILRQPNGGVASARNRAVRAARGSHILFMDDDNLALSHEVERFARAAAHSDADIVTCIPGRHPDTEMGPAPVAWLAGPDPDHPRCGVDWTPVGACPALAVFVNCLGDCNALYRKAMIEAMGGYGGDRHSSFEDFRFLVQAVVQGYRLEVLPEILFLYRRHRQSRSMRDNLFHSHVDSLLPLAGVLPPAYWPLLLAARSGWHARHLAQAEDPA